MAVKSDIKKEIFHIDQMIIQDDSLKKDFCNH
jgi:hypothetical protein